MEASSGLVFDYFFSVSSVSFLTWVLGLASTYDMRCKIIFVFGLDIWHEMQNNFFFPVLKVAILVWLLDMDQYLVLVLIEFMKDGRWSIVFFYVLSFIFYLDDSFAYCYALPFPDVRYLGSQFSREGSSGLSQCDKGSIVFFYYLLSST